MLDKAGCETVRFFGAILLVIAAPGAVLGLVAKCILDNI